MMYGESKDEGDEMTNWCVWDAIKVMTDDQQVGDGSSFRGMAGYVTA